MSMATLELAPARAEEPEPGGPVVVAAAICFNLLSVFHVRYLEAAAALGDRLIVIVEQERNAGGQRIDRTNCMELLRAIRHVDECRLSIDDDGTVCRTLDRVRPDVFARSWMRAIGDEADAREREACHVLGIAIVDGVGGRQPRRLAQSRETF